MINLDKFGMGGVAVIKKITYLLSAAFVLTCLSGCGSKMTGSEENAAVSETAIEVSEERADKEYSFCNEKYLYYTDSDDDSEFLVEHDRETGEKRRIAVGEDLEEVCYADNEWVYFYKLGATEEGDLALGQVWRMQVGGGKHLQEKTGKLVIEDDIGPAREKKIWCDGKYIVYICDGKYRQYNIARKKYETSTEMAKLSEQNDFFCIRALCGGYAVVDRGNCCEMVLKRLDSDQVTVLVDPSQTFEPFLTTKEDFYWMEGESDCIWRFRLVEGKKEKLIARSEIESLLKESGLLKKCGYVEKHTVSVSDLFFRDSRLYIEAAIQGYGDISCENRVVLSVKPANSATLKVEEELTKCLHNPTENQKVFKKIVGKGTEEEKIFESRGRCVAMTEELCIMYLENTEKKKNMYACYEFRTDRFRFLTKRDKEWWVQYYDYENNFPDREARWYLEGLSVTVPNNYDRE
ncbi:MAG: hypothetical protein J1F22_03905 [Lachnospiraceae bacterium]|nr:hypothetical protein [Lachnospiraceae bacterium]